MKKIFLLAALTFSSHLFAQKDSSKTLDEVIVSANKFPNKTSVTGKVVTVITRQDIERAGISDLSQLITNEGGVYVNGAGSNPGKDKSVFIRGARVEHSLITIDGVPVYDATGIGSNFDIRNIPVSSIERIEILKGSQSTLYGSDAIAGVINIITKKATGKSLTVDASVAYGSFNTLKGSAGLSGSKGKSSYELGYEHTSTDGISEAAGENFEKDGFVQNAVHGSLGINVTDRLKLQPFARYSKISGDVDQGTAADSKDYTYGINNLQAGLRNEFKTKKGSIKQLYQFTRTKREFINDSTDIDFNYEKNSFANYHSNEHFFDIYYVRPFGKFTGTFGSDYRASSTEYVLFFNYGFGGPDTLKDARQNQQSVYAALNYHDKGLTVETGGRYNHHSKYGGNAAFNFNPSYLFENGIKIFSNISTGYRTPSLYQLYSIYGNNDLKPEESFNTEAGIQALSDKGDKSIRVTWFSRNVKNLIVFYTSPAFEFYYINRDKQKDHGIELDGKISFGKWAEIKAFYSWANGEIQTKKGTKDTSYFNLYRWPQHNASVSIGSGGIKNLYVKLNANYRSGSSDVFFDLTSFRAKEVKLKEYALLNFYAEYKLLKEKLTCFADLRNLTGVKYQEVYGYSAPGFNAYGGLRFRW